MFLFVSHGDIKSWKEKFNKAEFAFKKELMETPEPKATKPVI